MFEFDQETVSALLKKDFSFRRIYNKHQELDTKISEAYAENLDDLHVEELKKKKLLLRDQLADMLRQSTLSSE